MEFCAREPAPCRCGDLAELVAASGGEWVRARAPVGATVSYPLSMMIEGEARAYLANHVRASAPSGGCARLPSARIYGSGVLLSADGTVLARDVAEDFGKTADTHWLLGLTTLRPPVRLDGSAAVVAVNRGAGYCHWLLEELPRLLALPRGLAEQVIAHAAGPWVRAAWAWRGGTERLVPTRRESHFEVGPLVVPDLAALGGQPTPESLAKVRDFAHGLGRDETTAGERVYVSRAKAGRRRVANEDELWRALEAEGFVRVFLEDLSWAQQIAVFRAARVVVGPHGAGLANLVFSAPGTRLVECVNRAYFNPVFWRVAALGGLDYRVVVSGACAAGGNAGSALREEAARNKDDITVNVARVRSVLAGRPTTSSE